MRVMAARQVPDDQRCRETPGNGFSRHRDGAGDRDRTGMASLEGWGSTIELHPRGAASRLAGPPPSSASRLDSRRHGVWRSLVAHLLWEQGAAGSNPVTPTSVEPWTATGAMPWRP